MKGKIGFVQEPKIPFQEAPSSPQENGQSPKENIIEPPPSPRTRKPIVPKTETPPKMNKKQRELSKLEKYHKRFKSMNANTYKSSITSEEFADYHVIADSYDARDPPERQPINKIAALMNKYNKPSYTAIDLGCGKNRLRMHENVSRIKWISVDVHANDDTVIVADMGKLACDEESYDLAVLSRSLWALNHKDVLKEVYRILKSGGRAFICESFRRWMINDDGNISNTLLDDLKDAGFEIIYEEGTKNTDNVEDVFQYIIVRKP